MLERQKVKPYFLPVQSAKKNRRSLSFFGEKATQHQGWAGFCAVKLPAFKPKLICQKTGVVFLTFPHAECVFSHSRMASFTLVHQPRPVARKMGVRAFPRSRLPTPHL
jgi:hypothetical protein